MAKLNGVTTQAERIQYCGVEYVKSAGSAVEGDIVRLNDVGGRDYLTENGFYEVVRIDTAGDAQVTDDDGDEWDTRSEDITVFKRTAAAETTQDDEVEHEGARYRKVARAVRKGDVLVIATKDGYDTSEGTVYSVEGIDSDGDPDILDDAGDRNCLTEDTYAVLEPLSDEGTITHQGAKYRKVARKAVAGDLIYAIKPDHNSDDYYIGYITNLYDDDGQLRFKDAVGDERIFECYDHEYNFAVLEPLPTAAPTTEIPEESQTKLPDDYVIHSGAVYAKESRKANEGETVIIVGERTHGWDIGTIAVNTGGVQFESDAVEIGRDYVDNGSRTPGKTGQTLSYPEDQYAVLVPTATLTLSGKAYAIEKRKANVGERILIVAAAGTFGQYANGDVLTVTSEAWRGAHVKSVGAPGNNSGYICAGEFVVLTNPTPAYVEVKRTARVGERIRIVAAEFAGRYASGEEFTVCRVNERTGGVRFTTGQGEAYAYQREYVVLETESPTESSAVSADKPLAVGDYAKLATKAGGYLGGFDVGDIVEIVRNHHDPDPKHYSVRNVNNDAYGYACKRNGLVRATDEEVETAKPAANLVQLAVGDYVKVVKRGGGHDYSIGDIVKVTKLDASDEEATLFCGEVVTSGRNGNLLSTKQTVSATDAEVSEAKRKSVKVGDSVRITESQSNWSAGTIVKVTEHPVDGFGAGTVRATDGNSTKLSSRYEPLSADEVAEASRLKVGEYARLLNADPSFTIGLAAGDIVKITKDDDSCLPFRVVSAAGADGSGWIAEKDIKRVTPGEAETARKQTEEAAETAKRSAIGRKVNEYRTGDIVINTGTANAGLGEVIDKSGERYRVKYYSSLGICTEPVDIIRLVTPVEQRFDR